MRVLVVDDEPDVLESTAALLEALGHEPAMCGKVSDVAQAMARHRAQLVLHDARMPGLDLAAHLRSLRADADLRDVPIVLFTASLSQAHRPGMVGADDGIEKPFDMPALAALLAKWEARQPAQGGGADAQGAAP